VHASGSASRIPLAALSAWLLLLPACASSLSPSTLASRSGFNWFKAAATLPDVRVPIRTNVNRLTAPAFVRLARAERVELAALYGVRAYSPLWIDASGRPNRAAQEALMLLEGAREEGLDPADYGMPELDRLATQLARLSDPASWASFDVALSASMLRFIRHLNMGRVDPSTVGFRLIGPTERPDFASLLRASVNAGRLTETVAMLKPAFVQYEALRETLIRYRRLAAEPGLALRHSDTPIRPGQPVMGLDGLHRMLVAFGDLPANTQAPRASGVYEGALVDGIRRFQNRHGLPADGVIGKATSAALAVPLSRRVRQIELALERLRWLPRLDDRRLVAANIPMFRLLAWETVAEENEPLLGMGVIVGRARKTQTPLLLAEMREVIFRPYWNVPQSIVRKEILPLLARDPEYLEREDMEILSGAGDGGRSIEPTAENLAQLKRGVLRLRQRPGPRNALGLVKFVFPNEADVYMHGTPAPQLFKQSRRDFSHGCVRVEDPVSLAEWVLRDDPQWTRDRILLAMHGTQTFSVRLARPIQVLLFYTTAAVMPEDGTIHFADDIYGHDATLDKALVRRGPGGAETE
jgi:murein L,D-transpeptidase YcbB/YkuD